MKRAISAILSVTFVCSPFLVSAETVGVNRHYLLSDADMTDVYSMSLPDIEQFLTRGGLATYVGPDVHGIRRSAADIIYRASQEFDLSPRFLLALLQREQSLVEDDSLSQNQLDWAMGYAVCDSCSKSDPRIQKFKGFGNQVHYAAERIRENYLVDLDRRGYTETGLGPGIEVSINQTRVIPANNATAVLYTYTPHLHGNANFVRIWDKWFDIDYVNGSLLQDNVDGGIWLIQHGLRRPITSRTAFVSRFDERRVIPVSSTVLDDYPVGSAISFPNYSLLRSPSGTVYLLVDDTRRGFTSMEAFRSLGFMPDEIVDVTWEDLEPYEEIEPITLSTKAPRGRLLQDSTTGGVFYAEDGVKNPIFSREVLAYRFPGQPIESMGPEELSVFARGSAVLFQDGSLIAVPGSPDVFVVSDGMRRHIMDELTFYSYGWTWDEVIWTTERAVLEHPLGEPLQISPTFDESELELAAE